MRTIAPTKRTNRGAAVSQVRAVRHSRRHSAHPNLLPLIIVAAAVIIGNLPALIHRVTTDPLLITAYLTEPTSSLLPGQPFIDPNSGYTTQALGHLVALDWLHGHIPWWNPLEGIGVPLAGEMQSGAFFPLTLLLVWHEGLLLIQMIIELASGWTTYLLVRRLGVGRVCSTAAGVAFGLCGTYAWLTHAPIRPVALLPVCLLGIELAIAASATGRRGGWILLAIGLALSILAGFPETTFIDAIFLVWWSVLRAIETDRSLWISLTRKLAAGVAVGLALAAPLLVAFADYLPAADTGPHVTPLRASVPVVGASQLVLPYAFGPILAFVSRGANVQTLTLIWGNVGGYLSATLIAAALVGLVGTRHRWLRMGLAAWIVVSLLRTFGFPPLVDLFAVIPGLRAAAFYRYANGSWELAVVVLAGFGVDDIARSLVRRRTLVVAATVTFLGGVWATVASWSVISNAATANGSVPHHAHLYALGNLAGVAVVLTLLVLGGLWAGRPTRDEQDGRSIRHSRGQRVRRRGRMVMAGAIGVEALLLFAFPYLSAPTPAALQDGSVRFLQANLGTYRFVTLGPIQPNYGSYFGIAQANVNDLPLPKSWANYTMSSLDPNTIARQFNGHTMLVSTGQTPAQALATHLANYEAVGVRYVVEITAGTDLQGSPFPPAGSPPWPAGPRRVYIDKFAEIWELPQPAPAFSLLSDGSSGGGSGVTPPVKGCTVTANGWAEATVVCPHPVTLVRRAQYLAGWSADIRGRSVPVTKDLSPPGLFQMVTVPAGTTVVRFSYLPRHEVAAGLAAAAAVVILIVFAALPFLTRRIRRRRATSVGGPRSPPAQVHEAVAAPVNGEVGEEAVGAGAT